MAMKTPDWVLEGYDSKADWEKAKGISTGEKKKGKTFKVRECPKCGSNDVGVVVEKETVGKWECHKCKWKGKDINETEINEKDFMKYLDEKGEEVS